MALTVALTIAREIASRVALGVVLSLAASVAGTALALGLEPEKGSHAAAASEWHGAGVWRSDDLGETNNLNRGNPDRAKAMGARLNDVRSQGKSR